MPNGGHSQTCCDDKEDASPLEGPGTLWAKGPEQAVGSPLLRTEVSKGQEAQTGPDPLLQGRRSLRAMADPTSSWEMSMSLALPTCVDVQSSHVVQWP